MGFHFFNEPRDSSLLFLSQPSRIAVKEKKKEKSAWNIKTRSLSPSLSVRARKRNVEKEEEEKSPRKAREGGNKETLFFLSTIFLIKLDQSETELRPWLHLLFKPVKIYYQTRLPTKASINPSSISFYPVDLIVSYSIRLVTSHNRSFLLEIDLPSSFAGQRNGEHKFRVRSRD